MNTKQTSLTHSSSLSSRLRLFLVIPVLAVMLMPFANVLVYYSGTGAAACSPLQGVSLLSSVVFGGGAACAQPAPAAPPAGCPGSNMYGPPSKPCPPAQPAPAAPPANTPPSQNVPPLTTTIKCTQSARTKCCPKGDCIFTDYIVPAVNTVSALVGVAVTISIIYGGIQYASSADNAQKVSAAKTRIVKSIFVLLGYFFLYAFLNYIIPGGLISAGLQ